MADYPPLFAVADFRNWSTMPEGQIDQLETKAPGFLAKQIAIVTSDIYSRLAKRYVTPMNPIPEIVIGWGLSKLTPIAYEKRGVDPDGDKLKRMIERSDRADGEIDKAADAVAGLYELPLLESAANAADAVTKGGPFGSSQQSPYQWVDDQANALELTGQR